MSYRHIIEWLHFFSLDPKRIDQAAKGMRSAEEALEAPMSPLEMLARFRGVRGLEHK